MKAQTMNHKEKMQYVKKILAEYHKATQMVKFEEAKYHFGNEEKKDKETYELNRKIVEIDSVLNLLMNDDRLVIENEFITVHNDFWWVEYYSKSTYYRHLNRAVEEFICYYQI